MNTFHKAKKNGFEPNLITYDITKAVMGRIKNIFHLAHHELCFVYDFPTVRSSSFEHH